MFNNHTVFQSLLVDRMAPVLLAIPWFPLRSSAEFIAGYATALELLAPKAVFTIRRISKIVRIPKGMLKPKISHKLLSSCYWPAESPLSFPP